MEGRGLMAFFHAIVRGRLFAIQVKETCGDDWIPAVESEAREAMWTVLREEHGTHSRATGAKGLDEERCNAGDGIGEGSASG
jgi:hypothetical protein